LRVERDMNAKIADKLNEVIAALGDG